MSQVYWSEWMESVRKDVECTFGILKQRFRILRNPMEFHRATHIDNIMHSCCIIHNMLLVVDGLNVINWETNIDWELEQSEYGITADHDDTSTDDFMEFYVEQNDRSNNNDEYHIGNNEGAAENLDNSNAVAFNPPPAVIHQLNSISHENKRRVLVTHFSHMYSKGLLKWPKGLDKTKKKALPIRKVHQAILRARLVLQNNPNSFFELPKLIVKESNLRTNLDNKKIGFGLFSIGTFKKDEKITDFIGEIITMEEYNMRAIAGKGGYCVSFRSQTMVLDCYQSAKDNVCFASMANSIKNTPLDQRRKLTYNAALRVDEYRKQAYLRGINNILPDTEITYSYQTEYIMEI